ncbi:MAG: arginine--tRNA ligase, partial [bacterium]
IIDEAIKALGRDVDRQQLEVTVPPSPEMGDLAVPCFFLAKLLRISPNQIAADLPSRILPNGLIKEVKNAGPYLNFVLDNAKLSEAVITEIKTMKAKFGSSKPTGQKVMLEYSQPNTHKEFHVGHLRNVALGSSLVNIGRFAGDKVIAANYIGDIGAHVAKCLWGLKKFHDSETAPENKSRWLGEIYAEATRKVAENAELKKEIDEIQQKLENGDKEWLALWEKTKQWSMDGFMKNYELLGAKFDHIFFESEVEKPGKKMVHDMLKQGIAQPSQGATIIDLDKYGLKQFLLLKSDGSSLYSTKELALCKLKFQKYKIDKSFVLVDNRQSFYFDQVFKTMEVIGFNKPMKHIAYDFVTLKDGAMSSRAGNVVLFEDLYQQVLQKAKEETKKRHEDWSEEKINATAKGITLCGLKFNMIKVGSNTVIVFDIDEALSFEGFSGPYIQYTICRINSILKKAKFRTIPKAGWENLKEEIERQLVLKLAEFPEAVQASYKNFDTSSIAKYLFDLSRQFASYYQKTQIIVPDLAVQKARLALVASVKQVLTNGLALLGIATLEEM